MGLFSSDNDKLSFHQKVWTITGIVLLVLLITGVFIYTFSVSLLLMAGIVLAVYLRMITDKLHRWTGWREMLCYVLSILITLILAGLLFWLIGAKVQDQFKELQDKAPEMKQKVAQVIGKSPILQRVAGNYTSALGAQEQSVQKSAAAGSDSAQAAQPQLDGVKAQGDSAKASAQAQPQNQQTGNSTQGQSSGAASSVIQKLFSSTFGFFGDLYTVFFLGVFLAATPKEYVNGIVSLIPKRGRRKARETLKRIGVHLRKWFKGMTLSVLITFAMTAIGLVAWGVDLWLVLAIIAGLLTFVPNIGPIVALIPAVLVGLLDSPQTAIYIAILYIVVQMVESNMITPFIQKKMLNTPAALLLFFQMVMGVLGGAWGVVMATPLLVVLMTTIQELYIGRPEE